MKRTSSRRWNTSIAQENHAWCSPRAQLERKKREEAEKASRLEETAISSYPPLFGQLFTVFSTEHGDRVHLRGWHHLQNRTVRVFEACLAYLNVYFKKRAHTRNLGVTFLKSAFLNFQTSKPSLLSCFSISHPVTSIAGVSTSFMAILTWDRKR